MNVVIESNDALQQNKQSDDAVQRVQLVVTHTIPTSQAEISDVQVEEATAQSEQKNTEKSSLSTNHTESVKIVIDDSEDEKPLTSPPRKSARLSAKRRDSTTESEHLIVTKCESPLPRRRSMRLGSTSSQDTPSPKMRDETTVKKLPTIVENEKTDTQNEDNSKAENENQNENALVDELAAAFVEEFID